MNIGFVGKGNVALSFAAFFEENNVDVLGFHTKSMPNLDIIKKSDIVFIATPDDQIEAAIKDLPKNAKYYCHFSGALSSEILSPLLDEEKTIASLHPIMTFAGKTDINGIYCAYEGIGHDTEGLYNFLNSLNLNIFRLSTKDKPLYHAAMCNCSNHISSLIYMTCQMLEKFNLSEDLILQIIAPLSKAALNNTLSIGPKKALTGPIARGDINTIKLQLPFTDDVYKKMGEKTTELALNASKIDEKTAKIIKDVLRRYENDNQENQK